MSDKPMRHKDVPDELVRLAMDGMAARDIRACLAAVLPAHEAMVRAEVAAEIERIEERDGDGSSWAGGMSCAAGIARGEGK